MRWKKKEIIIKGTGEGKDWLHKGRNEGKGPLIMEEVTGLMVMKGKGEGTDSYSRDGVKGMKSH